MVSLFAAGGGGGRPILRRPFVALPIEGVQSKSLNDARPSGSRADVATWQAGIADI